MQPGCRSLLSMRALWRSRLAVEGVFSHSQLSSFLPASFPSGSIRLTSTSSTSAAGHTSKYRTLLYSIGSIAGFGTALHYCTASRVYCRQTSAVPQPDSPGGHSERSPLPPVTLYEFPACPFCSKVRAFLNYYNIKYTAVSVNPVSRKEIEFTTVKKLPFIVVDGEKIHDSSLVISVLRTSVIRSLTVSESLQFYPKVNVTTSKGENTTEHSNKYFIMYGEEVAASTIGELREEREWREWVDDHLVHALPPNIYRSVSEARKTMAVVSGKSTMTTFQKFLAKNVASVALYFVGKRNAKKYDLKPDVRQSLYDYCDQWVEAIGSDRTFMGGAEPNLADLAVYGAMSATEGLDTFRDVHSHTKLGPWYSAMKELVNRPKPM